MSSSIVRRITALVTALLLLQLTLVGGNASCAVHMRSADAAAGEHQATSMATVGSASGPSHSATDADAASRQLGGGVEWQGAAPAESSCPTHGISGPCYSMTACATIAVGTAMAGTSVVGAHAARVITSRVLMPPTRTTAPEPPPPRS